MSNKTANILTVIGWILFIIFLVYRNWKHPCECEDMNRHLELRIEQVVDERDSVEQELDNYRHAYISTVFVSMFPDSSIEIKTGMVNKNWQPNDTLLSIPTKSYLRYDTLLGTKQLNNFK